MRASSIAAWILCGIFAVATAGLGSAYVRSQQKAADLPRQLETARSGNTRPRANPPADAAYELLLRQICDRLELMHDVARWKWNAEKPIEDPMREKELLDRIVLKAEQQGIDSAFARAFFRDQFEAAKIVQRTDFAEWTAAGAAKFNDVPDLATVQRPRIDAATNNLLAALKNLDDPRSPEAQARILELSQDASNRFGSEADPVRRAVRALFARGNP